MSNTVWLVVATQQGFYDNILRDPGEVFELLNDDDGNVIPATRYVPKLDAAGKEIPDAGTEQVIEIEGEVQHRDFAEDLGEKLIKSGPKRGEVHRYGWMRRVPAGTPVGMYPPDHVFAGAQAVPTPRKTPVAEKHHAQIKGRSDRPRFGS